MRRLFVRRSLTAVGIYSSVVLGFLGTVVATPRAELDARFGDYATVIFATASSQSFFDLTVEEALVKYGFRYIDAGGLGPAAAALLERAPVQARGLGCSAALGLVVLRARSRRHAARDAAARRRGHPARAVARRPRRLRALPARPLRHPLGFSRVVDGAAPRRDRGRRALRARRGDRRRARGAGRRDRVGRRRRAGRVPPLPAAPRASRSATTAARSSRSSLQSSARPASSRCAAGSRRSCSAR